MQANSHEPAEGIGVPVEEDWWGGASKDTCIAWVLVGVESIDNVAAVVINVPFKLRISNVTTIFPVQLTAIDAVGLMNDIADRKVEPRAYGADGSGKGNGDEKPEGHGSLHDDDRMGKTLKMGGLG